MGAPSSADGRARAIAGHRPADDDTAILAQTAHARDLADELLGVEQIRAALPGRPSASAVCAMIRRGELPGRRCGRRWVTTRSALLAWLGRPPVEPEPTPRPRVDQTILERLRAGRRGGGA